MLPSPCGSSQQTATSCSTWQRKESATGENGTRERSRKAKLISRHLGVSGDGETLSVLILYLHCQLLIRFPIAHREGESKETVLGVISLLFKLCQEKERI